MFHYFVAVYHWLMDTFFIALYNDMDGVSVIVEGRDEKSDSKNVPRNDSPSSKSLNASSRVINLRYIPPCVCFSFYLLDTLYLFLFNSSSGWTFGGASPTDGTMGRILLPANVAQQADVFFTEVNLLLFGVAVQFLLHDMTSFNEKYRFIAVLQADGTLKEMKQNGKILPKSEADAILKLHAKPILVSKILTLVIIAFGYPFYDLNGIINWTGLPANVKGFLWINSALPYVIMHLYVTVLCFAINCRYLCIRQRYQMERIRALIEASNRILGNTRHIIRARRPARGGGTLTRTSWIAFSGINSQLDDLGKTILGYNAYWSRYLSVYFAGLTFLVTYMAFLALKLSGTENNLLAVAFLSYFACILGSLLLGITLECSVLVYNNKEILKHQRTYSVHTSLVEKSPLYAAIKFDHIEANSMAIDRIGFRLLDSVQINSKMFEMLLFYVSSLFMKIVQHEL